MRRHPRRKPAEIRERLDGLFVGACGAHESIDPVRVRPVGFHGNRGKPFLADQPPGDVRPLAVELVGPMRRFAQEHDARVADTLNQRIVLARIAAERDRALAEDVDCSGLPRRLP